MAKRKAKREPDKEPEEREGRPGRCGGTGRRAEVDQRICGGSGLLTIDEPGGNEWEAPCEGCHAEECPFQKPCPGCPECPENKSKSARKSRTR